MSTLHDHVLDDVRVHRQMFRRLRRIEVLICAGLLSQFGIRWVTPPAAPQPGESLHESILVNPRPAIAGESQANQSITLTGASQ